MSKRKRRDRRQDQQKTAGGKGNKANLEGTGQPIVPEPALVPLSAGLLPKLVDAVGASEYLVRYIQRYRQEYARLVASPPGGFGFPDLRISAFLYSNQIKCCLAKDGYVIWDGWDVPGVPGKDEHFMVRIPANRTEPEFRVLEGRKAPELRVENAMAPLFVRLGELPTPVANETRIIPEGASIEVYQVDASLTEVLERIFFGADFFVQLKDRIPEEEIQNFWMPRILEHFAFISKAGALSRYIHYLEMSRHVEAAAWDPRTVWARVNADVARDYSRSINHVDDRSHGTILIPSTSLVVNDRLNMLAEAIRQFEELLATRGDETESVFHDFLYANSILLDVYGKIVSKPRWHYPVDSSQPPTKAYVEPDFVVCYHGGSYKCIEIERPSKPLATGRGYPRSEVTQSAHQLAEWKRYLKLHAHLLQNDFPGIGMDFRGMLVISRSTQESIGSDRDIEAVKEELRLTYSADEIYTYDDLLIRARRMYERLLALSINLP